MVSLQENIDCEIIAPEDDYLSIVDVIDQHPGTGTSGNKGLIWLLEEESSAPGGSDESFLERFFLYFGNTASQAGE